MAREGTQLRQKLSTRGWRTRSELRAERKEGEGEPFRPAKPGSTGTVITACWSTAFRPPQRLQRSAGSTKRPVPSQKLHGWRMRWTKPGSVSTTKRRMPRPLQRGHTCGPRRPMVPLLQGNERRDRQGREGVEGRAEMQGPSHMTSKKKQGIHRAIGATSPTIQCIQTHWHSER